MRKYITLFWTIMAIAPMLEAQTVDTIYPRDGKVEGYYYHTWYSDCDIYDSNYPAYTTHKDLAPFTIGQNGSPGAGPFWTSAKADTTERPIAITGVGVWQTNRADRHTLFLPGNDTMKPEYVLIFQYAEVNGRDTVLLRACARWDTAQPKTLMLPMTNDSTGTTAHSGYLSCELYEITLDTPVVVDSLFYMVGTLNNNQVHPTLWELLTPTFTQYARINDYHSAATCRFNLPPSRPYLIDDSTMNLSFYINGNYWGLYMARVDFADVDVQVNDTLMGSAGPSGQLSKWTTQTFVAEPKPGYAFVQWNDGVNDNPRDVYITQDTSFIAFFTPRDHQYQVNVSTESPEVGYATGGGTYYEYDTATLEAFPASDQYRFSFWNDGDTANPRSIVVTQDTSFIAFFEDAADTASHDTTSFDTISFDTTAIAPVAQAAALFTLAPNPATGKVTVEVKSDKLKDKSGVATLTLRDAAGHEVRRLPLPAGDSALTLDLSDLPAGAYFVTLATPTASSTQRLVVK